LARAIEPWAPTPAMRFETLRTLSRAGVPTGVAIAPLIPGLTESQVPEILERAREAGASQAFTILLRLPAEVRPVFEERLRAALPLRAEKVFSALAEMRAAQSSSSAFGARMQGAGPRWEAARALFELTRRRLGYETVDDEAAEPLAPREPARPVQRTLFD